MAVKKTKHKPLSHPWCAALLTAFLSLSTAALSSGAEKTLHYLQAGHPDAAALLAPPPRPGSDEQAADLATVKDLARACTTNAAAIAFGEKKFSMFTFTPAVGDFLQPGALPKTEALLEHAQQDAAAATDAAKGYWKRPRPFTVDPTLASGKLEKSFSYPSGHATEGMVLALVLADLFPERREAILAVGRGIGWHRVWIARHYPTDIYAGRVFAQAIVRELKGDPQFRGDFAAALAEVAALGKRAPSAAPATAPR